MKELDLHGIRHDEARRLIERFIYNNDLPVKIITGHSLRMKSIINEILNEIWLNEGLILNARNESIANQGAVVITN